MRRRTLARAAGLGVGLAVAALVAAPAAAQQVRISGITSVRYLEIKPLVEDSVALSETSGEGLLRRSADGQLVRCLLGRDFCQFYRAGGTERGLPTVQDLTVSAWGFGRGLRVYARLRARSALGTDETLWPHANDAFDALVAYVELDRERYRIRAGRNWKVSGLGYYNFDGASVLVRPVQGLDLELFGGWSLARGTNEPVTSDALAAIEPFAPDSRGVLVGAEVRYRPSATLGVSALYQREIRADRAALYSERGALDASARRGRASARGSLEVDLVSRTVNEARLDVDVQARSDLIVGAFARRYSPFFELWTIWGAFTPVGFREGGLSASWRRRGSSFHADAQAAWRSYAETTSDVSFLPVRSSGWRVGLGAGGALATAWTLQGGYHADVGLGAGLEEGTVTLRRALGDGWLGGSVTAFRGIDGFRVDDGSVLGLALDASHRLGGRTRVSGSLAGYRHLGGSEASTVDWNQIRGTLRLEWTLGPEPGLATREGGTS